MRASVVEDDFHARFGAKEKIYRYEIDTGPVFNPLRISRAWHHPEKIDYEILRRACSVYVGEHDFASFAANRKDRKRINTVRKINSVDVVECPHGSDPAVPTFRFCPSQVRWSWTSRSRFFFFSRGNSLSSWVHVSRATCGYTSEKGGKLPLLSVSPSQACEKRATLRLERQTVSCTPRSFPK